MTISPDDTPRDIEAKIGLKNGYLLSESGDIYSCVYCPVCKAHVLHFFSDAEINTMILDQVDLSNNCDYCNTEIYITYKNHIKALQSVLQDRGNKHDTL